jgi:outer membrane protein, heavy metal efflux system
MKKIILRSLICLAACTGKSAEFTDLTPIPRALAPEMVSLPLTPAYVNQLAEEMRTNRPALLAASARTNAAAAGVAAVRTWEDPMLRLGGMASDQEMRSENGDIIYGAEQKLPLWGKPGLAKRVARAELAVETANADYQFQILKSELAKTVFRTALAEQVVVIGRQDLAWLQTTTEAANSKYEAGQATLVEVLQIKNEQAKRATQLETDRENLAHDRVSLNRLLNRDLRSPWPQFELPAVAGPVLFNQKLVSYASNYEPRLRMMREQINQAQATVDSTRRSRMPDVSAGAISRNYSGNGDWRQAEFMLSFSLPVFNTHKYRADVRRDESKLRATELDAVDYELSLREELHALTVKIDNARREALLYRDDIIPRSESALNSARAGWESGRNSFRDVLDARRMLLEGRLMYARAVSEQYQMLSELVLCCGLGDLEALQMIGAVPEAKNEKTNP